MQQTPVPRIETLDRGQCDEILLRNQVGRIAYATGDRVDIEPLHYVYDGVTHLYGRTSRGSKFHALRRNSWVAFEVDEIDALFDWRSVVVHGPFEPLSEAEDPAAWARALELLRTLIPETLGEGDPAPFRRVVFRIGVQEVTGRTASTP